MRPMHEPPSVAASGCGGLGGAGRWGSRRTLSRLASIGLAAWCAGCTERVPLALEAPISAGDAAMIVAFLSARGAELVAVDLTAGPAAVVAEHDDHSATTVTLLVFRAGLESLELTAGPIPTPGPGEPSRPLPVADAIYTARLDGGESSGWSRASALDPRLEGLRIPGQSPCDLFEAEPMSLPSPGGGVFALRIPGDAALVGTAGGGVFRVEHSGEITELQLSAPVLLTGGFQPDDDDPRDTVLLGSDEGQLFAGRVSTGELLLTPITTSTRTLRLQHVAGDPAGRRFFSVSSRGLFERFDEAGWATLWDFGTGRSGGGLTLLRSGDALAGWANTSFILRHRDGVVVEEEFTPASRPLGVRSLQTITGLGTLLGTVGGRIFLNDGTGWAEVADSPVMTNVISFAPYEGGFLAGAIAGLVARYDRGRYCELPRHSSSEVHSMVPFGRDVLLVHNGDFPVDTDLTFLRAR